MEKIKLKNKYILPFKFRKLKNGDIFLATDLGTWVVLSKKDFIRFVQGKISNNEDLYEVLVNNNMMLPYGMELDKGIIMELAGKWIKRHNYLLYGPSLHIIVVGLLCNQVCVYCHASAKPTGGNKFLMGKKLAKKIVDVIFETTAGDITIEFQGGEPLMNWEVVKFIIEYAKEKNKKYNLKLNFALVSNLTLMDDEKMEYLIKEDVNISTSLDGPKEVHDRNRKMIGGGGSFDKVVYWIKKINKEYKKNNIRRRVGAIGTVTKKTLSYAKEIVDLYDSLGLQKIFFRPLNPYGFASKVWDIIGYTSDEYLKFTDKLVKNIELKQKDKGVGNYLVQGQKTNVVIDSFVHGIYFHNLFSSERVNYMEERTPCGAVLGQVAYNYDGKIYTCDEGRMLAAMGNDSFKIGEIDLNKSSKKIYENMIKNNVTKYMARSSLIDFLPGYRHNPFSSFIGLCPIYSYIKSGNVISKYKKEDRFLEQEFLFEKTLDLVKKGYKSNKDENK